MSGKQSSNRRNFMKYAAGAAVSGTLMLSCQTPANKTKLQSSLKHPVFDTVDVLVVGGGPAGIGAAMGQSMAHSSQTPPQQQTPQKKIKCQKCGAEAPEGTKFCNECGTKIIKPGSTACPKCGAEVPEGVKFCNECGQKMTLSCPKCGAAVKPGVKFCNECGTKMGG